MCFAAHKKFVELTTKYREASRNEKKKMIEIDMLEMKLLVIPFAPFAGSSTVEENKEIQALFVEICKLKSDYKEAKPLSITQVA